MNGRQRPLSPEGLVAHRADMCYTHVSLHRAADLETVYLDWVIRNEAPFWPPLDGKGKHAPLHGPLNDAGERLKHGHQRTN